MFDEKGMFFVRCYFVVNWYVGKSFYEVLKFDSEFVSYVDMFDELEYKK